MAIKTGAIFNSLIFGGVDSADYGIYITGEAIYNAPVRAVELVSVAGRNGSVAIDQGRWENIEVTYKAGTFGDDQTDFSQAISDFRNAVVSQIGYQRLTDTYHPDEYRMAIYTEGLEVASVRRDNGTAGEFTIKFNCKPQRWLTSGEEAVAVSSGDTLTNPTYYDSNPLLAVQGSGAVEFNGYRITLANQRLGTLEFGDQENNRNSGNIQTGDMTIAGALFNDGDQIIISNMLLRLNTDAGSFSSYTSQVVSNTGELGHISIATGIASIILRVPQTVRTQTGSGTIDITATISIRLVNKNPPHNFLTADITFRLRTYRLGTQRRVNLQATVTPSGFNVNSWEIAMYNITGYSTVSALGNPTYIDCEIGEAYKYVDNELIPINNLINFGSDLPTLKSGANEITYSGNVTSVEITPRWWQL